MSIETYNTATHVCVDKKAAAKITSTGWLFVQDAEGHFVPAFNLTLEQKERLAALKPQEQK